MEQRILTMTMDYEKPQPVEDAHDILPPSSSRHDLSPDIDPPADDGEPVLPEGARERVGESLWYAISGWRSSCEFC